MERIAEKLVITSIKEKKMAIRLKKNVGTK